MNKEETADLIRFIFRLLAAALLPICLSGCISGINYGKIPHEVLSAGVRCNPQEDNAANLAGMAMFAITTRLPDCRLPALSLTDFRADKPRYLRFGDPRMPKTGKAKKPDNVPFDIQSERQWWADLADAAQAHDGRVLLYVHGFRETFLTSSRDSAQIARLAEFGGPVIQYSWPSHGELLSYGVDEANMYWDQRNFRSFLQALAEKPWVKDMVIKCA